MIVKLIIAIIAFLVLNKQQIRRIEEETNKVKVDLIK